MRFRAVERQQKEEKERRRVKRNSLAHQSGPFFADPNKPANRHGAVGEQKNLITATSYKKKLRLEVAQSVDEDQQAKFRQGLSQRVGKDRARRAGLAADGADGGSKQDLLSSFASHQQDAEMKSGQHRASYQSLDQKKQKALSSKLAAGVVVGSKVVSSRISGRKPSDRSELHSQSQGDVRAQSSPKKDDDLRSSFRGQSQPPVQKELTPAEHVEQYKLYFEQLERRMIKERQKARMKNFGSGAEMDEENQAKRRALKQAEYDREFERLTVLANTRTPYQDAGDKMIHDMRQQQLAQEQAKNQTTKVKNYLPSLYGKDGKIDVKKFNPSATELLKMTPSQKQNLINRIKLVQKKAEEEKALDPQTIKE